LRGMGIEGSGIGRAVYFKNVKPILHIDCENVWLRASAINRSNLRCGTSELM
jgi:hypothetical protein